MESGVTLADIRKEETLQRNCTKVGIVYIPRTANETEQERDARHHQLQLAIKSKRRIENKSQQSPDKERRIRESNVHNARRINAASMQQQESARQINTASRRRQREMQQEENDVINDYDDIIPDPPTKEHIDSLVQEAIKQVTRTRRDDGSHQATVCVVCDCLIIGEEKVHLMPKERLENNKNRLSVQTYEQNFGEIHPLLIEQYQVAGLEGMLLSPRSYRSGDNFVHHVSLAPNHPLQKSHPSHQNLLLPMDLLSVICHQFCKFKEKMNRGKLI